MKILREKAGLTQEELAIRVRVSQEYISKIEHGIGVNGLPIGKLKKIARALNVCECELLRKLAKTKCKRNCSLYKKSNPDL